MLVESLSLLSAFLYACSSILTKRGLRNSNPYSAALVSSVVNTVFFGLVYLLAPVPFSIEPIVIFAVAGVLASFFGRLFLYRGLDEVDVSITSSIVGSSPLFSAVTAAILLGERFEPVIYIGILLIVSGVATLSLGGRTRHRPDWRRSGIVWALLASACYGLSVTTRKVGYNILNSPILGATTGAFASLSVYLTFLMVSRRGGLVSTFTKGDTIFFVFAGVCSSLGLLTSHLATSWGAVTIVSTLVGSYPLFALVLSVLVLREKISVKTLLGSVFVILGVLVISMY
jgi:uncharacterized membrane protein